MRVPKLRRGPICDFERTVTPMVDVVFMLLLFFVLASGGHTAEATLAASLPAGAISTPESRLQEETSGEFWIRLRRDAAADRTLFDIDGRVFGDQTDLNKALATRARAKPGGPVILDVAADVPFGDVIAVYDACRAAKFHSINFGASPEEIERP